MERNFKQQLQSTHSSFPQEQYIEISSELDLTWPSNFGLKVDPSISANKSLLKNSLAVRLELKKKKLASMEIDLPNTPRLNL